MPALRALPHGAALLGFLSIAVAFSWPIPAQLGHVLPGPAGSDTGVYIWNLWVFRHEILEHGRFPFFTLEILSVTAPAPLTLHNYTTFANLLAFPLQAVLGTVATFNLLLIASTALAAYAMFLLARQLVADDAAAWLAGLVFGFSPFMSARLMEHFSLVQAAPLPIFALLLLRLGTAPTTRIAAAAGLVIAWAFLCDPYYAVYCLLMAAFAMTYAAVSVKIGAAPAIAFRWHALLDVSLVCLGGLILGIVVRGGGRFEVLGLTVSMRRLYTPVLMFTVLAILRVWIALHPRIAVTIGGLKPHARAIAVASFACLTVLSPVLSAMAGNVSNRQWIGPSVLWRSSPAGLDLLAFFVPNPTHPLWGSLFHRGIGRMPGGFVENVGAIPWVAMGLLVAAFALARTRLPRYWVLFTAFFGLLALGPFIGVAGIQTHIPTPWALLRYLPVIGAARTPTRFAVLVMLGISVLVAIAVRDLRQRWKHPALVSAAACALLIFELAPAPRFVHPARVPSVYSIIRDDPRPVRVLQLPFGLRDGTSSAGNFSAEYQYYQTVHEKRLIGGYLSRLPRNEVDRYRQFRLVRVLLDLSAGQELPEDRLTRAALSAQQTLADWQVAWVVIHAERASPQLQQFARESFGLTYVSSDGPYQLYKRE